MTSLSIIHAQSCCTAFDDSIVLCILLDLYPPMQPFEYDLTLLEWNQQIIHRYTVTYLNGTIRFAIVSKTITNILNI
jgi:hypothetical protein